MLNDTFNVIANNADNGYGEFLSCLKDKNIILYGAGGIGCITYNILKNKGLKVRYFVDDDQKKWGKQIDCINIVSLEDIDNVDQFVIVITVPCPIYIYNELKEKGLKNVYYFPIMMAERRFYDKALILENQDKINEVYGKLEDELSKKVFTNILEHRATMDFGYFNSIVSNKQYFPEDIITFNDEECFVDGGAYDNGTIVDFLKATNYNYKFIYAFEPDALNYQRLSGIYEQRDNSRIKIFNLGLYSRTGEIGFCANGNSSSFICEEEMNRISLTRLDDVIYEHIPTYIKLDIEGAEKEALYGMENTIKLHQPKLAISIYHRPEDLWELPLLMLKLNSGYKIYMRHYLRCLNETVCYAL